MKTAIGITCLNIGIILGVIFMSITERKKEMPKPKEYNISGMRYCIIEGHLVNLTHDSMMCHSKVILQYSTLVRQ